MVTEIIKEVALEVHRAVKTGQVGGIPSTLHYLCRLASATAHSSKTHMRLILIVAFSYLK